MISVFMIAALLSLQGAPPPSSEPAVCASAVTQVKQSSSEVERDFGAIHRYSVSLIGAQPGSGQIGEIQWIETAFSEYDIQSQPSLAALRVVSGVLVFGEEITPLMGERRANMIHLFDASLLFGAPTISHTWDGMMDELQRLNSKPLAADLTVRLTLDAKGETEPSVLSLTIANDAVRASLRLATPAGQMATSVDRSTAAPHLWTGMFADSYDDGRPMRMRLATATYPTLGDRSPTTVGLITLRPAERRFEGAMPEGSPWIDRRQLAIALRRLSEAGIAWEGGEFGERAATILAESAGRPVAKQEFDFVLGQLFGSVAGAGQLLCSLVEVQHVPVLKRCSGDTCWFVGLRWIPADVSESGRFHRFLVQRLTAPRMVESGSVAFDQGRIWEAFTQHLQLQVHMTKCCEVTER